MKKALSLFLALCLMLAMTVSAYAIGEVETEVQVSGETAGDMRLQMTLDAYFEMRNDMFYGEPANVTKYADTLSVLSSSSTLSDKNLSRLSTPEDWAKYLNVHIVEVTVSYRVESVTEIMPYVFEAEVYEWTWVEYNDGNGGPIDEMGFGTEHVMVLNKLKDGNYIIAEDVYDDSDVMDPYSHAEMAVSEPVYNPEEAEPASTYALGVNQSAGLDVEALVKYADAWVYHKKETDTKNYPDYYNNNEYIQFSADCANYVSQCLKAGGMVNDKLSGIGWWYEKVESNKSRDNDKSSDSWRRVPYFVQYWTSQGYKEVQATTSTVFPGNPVITNDGGHVIICVGYNADGDLIFNAHTTDRYHFPYKLQSFWTTIQIIKMNHNTHTYLYTGSNIFTHTCKCVQCGQKHEEAHNWIKMGTYYKCSICSMESATIPEGIN